MNLFINAINLSSAGGLNVTLNFLKSLRECRPDGWWVHVVAPRHCGYEALATDWLRLIWLPAGANHWLTRLHTDYVWLPALIRDLNPDVVFTMGNFATPTPVRQVLLLHYPHPAYAGERVVWQRLGWRDALNVWVRNRVFTQRLQYANVLLVQTETIRKRIRDAYPRVPSIRLFPNAYTQLNGQETYQLPTAKEDGVRDLLCLSRYYPHKNIEVLVEVARLICERRLPYRILLTIEPEEHRNARRLLNRIRREGLSSVLVNIGTVPTDGVPALYRQVDGLILPTLLESFSATYVDVMHFGLPVFTSRRDFAEEICGNCAYYFDPLSAENIVSIIDSGFGNPALMAQKIQDGRLRSAMLPDWATVTQLGIDAIESLMGKPLVVSTNAHERY